VQGALSGGIRKRGASLKGGGSRTANLRVADPSKLLKKGRQLCYCMGMHHRLIGNCVACGLVVCEQVGEGVMMASSSPIILKVTFIAGGGGVV
jgi:hypothetical protein